jgi:hypothetical protein
VAKVSHRLIRELAVRHVTSWNGVALEGGPAPPTPENIAAAVSGQSADIAGA